jgi:hypothetical protein
MLLCKTADVSTQFEQDTNKAVCDPVLMMYSWSTAKSESMHVLLSTILGSWNNLDADFGSWMLDFASLDWTAWIQSRLQAMAW